MNKGKLIYEGKAKRLYDLEDESLVFQEFKDSLTAFNGEKKAEMKGKGHLNRNMASLIFRLLQKQGIPTHWVKDEGDTGMVTQRVQIVPLEVVVRNVLAGSLAKKAGRAEGQELSRPIVDLHLKDDALGDPFISEDQAVIVFEAATHEEVKWLKTSALQINTELKKIFSAIGLRLVDFKLEFGRLPNGSLVLADEISPDTCRLWDIKTGEKRDKDRFRRDMGQVLENYEWVCTHLNEKWGATV